MVWYGDVWYGNTKATTSCTILSQTDARRCIYGRNIDNNMSPSCIIMYHHIRDWIYPMEQDHAATRLLEYKFDRMQPNNEADPHKKMNSWCPLSPNLKLRRNAVRTNPLSCPFYCDSECYSIQSICIIYIYTYKYINTPDDRCIYSHTRIYIHERKHLSPVLQVVFLSKNHYTSSPINAPGLACSQRSPPCAAKCNRQKPGWDRSPGLDMGLAWEKSDSYSGIWCWNMMLAKHI